ncbi:MAG: hypothetical protein NZ730_06585 [Porticoccaceae bacterium]|nr:hypothetical protein [Porticoccaceae bacterium]
MDINEHLQDENPRAIEIARDMLSEKVKDPYLVWEAMSADGVICPVRWEQTARDVRVNESHCDDVAKEIGQLVLAKDDCALGKLVREQVEGYLIKLALVSADMDAIREELFND